MPDERIRFVGGLILVSLLGFLDKTVNQAVQAALGKFTIHQSMVNHFLVCKITLLCSRKIHPLYTYVTF